MSNLDDLIVQLNTTDTHKKINLGIDILNLLENVHEVECDDIGRLIDGLIPWIQSSNFKIVLNGLAISTILINKLGDDFRPYITSVIPPTIDRLGDSKDAVRDKAQILLAALTEIVLTPNQLFEKVAPAFTHKNGKVREEIMLCLQNTLEIHGAPSVTISRLMPLIVKLLSDPTAPVRDCAFNTIIECYKHYGEKLRAGLQKKFNVPPTKLPALMSRFDEARDNGLLLSTASSEEVREDETDRASVKSTGSKLRASSAPPVKRSGIATSTKSTTATGTAAGAVDESSFFAAFEDVPAVKIYSGKDLEDSLSKIKDCINNTQNDWDKRAEALKKIRSLIVAGGANYPEFFTHLRLLEPAMQLSIRDLRSQVVREACISVAYMSQELHHKLDHFCESVLPALINLIQNTAKIMSSAGAVTVRFVIQNTHHHRLIPLLTRELSSKSREIRKASCEFVDQLVHTWPTTCMEKHVALLADAIKKGITDADPEARAFARKAYWGFAEHFREQADKLLASLDPSYKKMLQGESAGSSKPASRPWSRSSSAATSTENLSRRTPVSVSRPPVHQSPSPTSFRSNSAIDLQAARRAQARTQYAQANRLKMGSRASLPRPQKDYPPPASPHVTNDRTPRSRSKLVSQSQPGSRSGSPSSRLSYATYQSPSYSGGSSTLGRPRRRSGIPRSTGTSRDPSPNRGIGFGSSYSLKSRTRSISGTPEMPPQIPGRFRSHHLLQQSREAENALADALVSLPPNLMRSPRKMYSKSMDDQSDESETSSICSERSFDSFRRNDYGLYGSQQRMIKELYDFEKMHNNYESFDVNEIIMKSASTHWADRKEGLQSLQVFLKSSNSLTGSELRRVTELFTKMFMDSHTKVFNLFLDALMELIIVHHADLYDWLYILLTRLLNKLGSDLLGSVQTRIHRTLDLVRDFFPCDLQFQALMRFLTDSTQTPNTKVKVAMLTYLKCLLDVMSPSDFHSDSAPVAIGKLLTWTTDGRSADIRRAASAAFVAMWNCNSSMLTALLQQLPHQSQDTASQLIKNHLQRAASVDASPSSLPPRTPPSMGGTPLVANSPSTSLPRPRPTNIDFDDTENLNPEDVIRSLKRTTDEIRNYSFEQVLSNDRRESLEKHRDSTSQDSGISQLSMGGIEQKNCDAIDSSEVNGVLSGRSSNTSSPTQRGANGCIPDEDFVEFSNESDIELMSSIIFELGNMNDKERVPEKENALNSLIRLARTGSTLVWNEHFRVVLRLLLERLNNDECPLRDVVLGVLTEMMRRCPLVQHFLNFSELIILRVLKASGDQTHLVRYAAQLCYGTVAEILPPDVVIRVLKPLIQMAEYPLNHAAIKMLNKLVEAHPSPIIATILPEIMPALLKAYDNAVSIVRKASVFCMVALHKAVGEDVMKPYLSSLTGSKLKLLNLYIKKSEAQNSGASSPKSDLQV